MRTDILFKEIRRSNYLEDFISDKIDVLVEKLAGPDNDTHVTVRVEKCRERTNLRHPIFQCEITVKSGMSPKIFKVTKSDRNIFRAIVSGFDALKVNLSKSHDRLRNDRRRRRVPEFITPPPPTPVLS